VQDQATEQAPFVAHMSAEWSARTCARCDHRSDRHLWGGTNIGAAVLPTSCLEPSCACTGWTFEPKRPR
jgi:hypothetical protein